MSVQVRNVNSKDIGLNPEINAAFTTQAKLVKLDVEVAKIYNVANKLLSNVFSPYVPYQPLFGESPSVSKNIELDGKDIIVKGVSDSRISYTTTIVGNIRKIKITSSWPTDIPFKINVSYKRSLDQKEFTQDIDCLFKSAAPYTLTQVSGNNQIGEANQVLTNPLIVLVKDNKGFPLSGVSAIWNVAGGVGKVASRTSLTDASGKAEMLWTLGDKGPQIVTASVRKPDESNIINSPIRFDAVIGLGQTFISYKFNGVPVKVINPLAIRKSSFSPNAGVTNFESWTITAADPISRSLMYIVFQEKPQKGKVYNFVVGGTLRVPYIDFDYGTDKDRIRIYSFANESQPSGSVTITATEPYVEVYFNLNAVGFYQNRGSTGSNSLQSTISEGIFKLKY